MPQSAIATVSVALIRTKLQSATAAIAATAIRVKSQSAVARIETSTTPIFNTGNLVPEGRDLNGRNIKRFRFDRWNTYTPICSWSNVNPVGTFRIIGDILELRLSIQLNIGSTPSGNLTLTLPPGLTINQNTTPNLVEFPPAGKTTLLLGSFEYVGPASYDAINNLVIFQGISPTYPFAWSIDDALDASVKIPVEL